MDFDLSADQGALRDAARELLDDRCPTIRVRQVHESPDRFDRDLWTQMVEQGWLGVAVPEADGGLGLGVVELAVLLEELGRHVAPVPFLSSAVAVELARRAGAADVVAGLLDGSHLACLVAATSAGTLILDGGRVTGRSAPVAWAPVADLAVIVADGSDGPSVVLVDLDGRRPERVEAMDLTRPLGRLELDGADATVLGGAELVDVLTDLGATATACEMLGAADAALALAVEYAKDRVQFGRPIGSFQAIKHRCADMLVDVEGMRSSAYWAAWCLAVEDPDRSIAASTAKTWAGDASKRVMAGALQVHGGIGFTWEHDLHLFLKRAQLDQLSFGDSTWHRVRLGGLLRSKVDAGISVL